MNPSVHPSARTLSCRYGQFYGGDSYVVLYTYQKNKKTEHIIYFWLGHTSSTDEIGTYWRTGSIRMECSYLTVARHALREYYIISYHSVYETLYPDLIRLFYVFIFSFFLFFFLSFFLSFCSLSNTSLNFIGSAALLASEMDKSLGGRPVQVCVCACVIFLCVYPSVWRTDSHCLDWIIIKPRTAVSSSLSDWLKWQWWWLLVSVDLTDLAAVG